MKTTPNPTRTTPIGLVLFLLTSVLLRVNAADAPSSMVKIWPGAAPGTENWTHTEEWYGDAMDGPVQGLHVRNVTVPGVSVYLAPREIANGTAVIIAPGGGFTSNAWEKEGTLMAEWLQKRGVSSFVLKYRLTPQGASNGRGGRGAAPFLVAGTSASQQATLSAMERNVASLVTAAAAARTELTRASLASPSDRADIAAKAETLRSSEQALALARAEAFANLQASTDRLSPNLTRNLVLVQTGAARGGAGGLDVQALAVADGRQAMRHIKANAANWGIDPARLGFVGFSAGGYIAVRLAVEHDAETRPAFVGAVYACCAGTEVEAPADAPPLFMASAYDDGISFNVHAGLLRSWKAVNQPAEIHLYSTGGHGFGMATRGLPSDSWIERFGEWMRTQKLMNP